MKYHHSRLSSAELGYTLAEWCELAPSSAPYAYVRVGKSGEVYVLGAHGAGVARWELFHLADYVVSSVTSSGICLVPRELGARSGSTAPVAAPSSPDRGYIVRAFCAPTAHYHASWYRTRRGARVAMTHYRRRGYTTELAPAPACEVDRG